MIIYRNKSIPFQGYKAIFLFGILFVKGNAKIGEVDMLHERIHSKQYIELGVLFLILFLPLVFYSLWWLWLLLGFFGFYIVYVIEWSIRSILYKGNTKKAYKNMSFEKEAYGNQNNVDYLKNRKLFSWLKYIRNT